MYRKANKESSGFMMQTMFSYLAFWKQTWNK